jgi:hypothetical protein
MVSVINAPLRVAEVAFLHTTAGRCFLSLTLVPNKIFANANFAMARCLNAHLFWYNSMYCLRIAPLTGVWTFVKEVFLGK